MSRFAARLMILLAMSLAGVNLSAEILLQKLMWENPNEYVIDKSFTNYWWNVDLFCRTNSGSQGYIGYIQGNGHVFLDHSMLVFADRCFNRLLYLPADQTAIRSYGTYGSGVGKFSAPMTVKMQAPISYSHNYETYYNFYVADRDNNRVQRLRYRWTRPDSGLIHVRYYTDVRIDYPVDLDIDNSGTFYPDNDDYVWVACANNTISAISVSSGSVVTTYGSTGSGVGQFNGITAIACGRSWEKDFANTDTIYVADSGNQRIVRLAWTTGTPRWVDTSCPIPGVNDLDVDNFGQVWATTNSGCVHKLLATLKPLDISCSPGTKDDQFNHPVCISNTGGYLAGGDMMITEDWTNESGIKAYAMRTDIKDLYAVCALDGSVCNTNIYFTLTDYSYVSSTIYDNQGRVVRSGATQMLISGLMMPVWDGRNNSGQLVPWGSYRIEVTASSLYRNRITGQPVNTVTKDTWVTLCQGGCITCGDADGNHMVNISDPVFLINYIFAGGLAPADCGTPLYSRGYGDADGNGIINISDAVMLINYIFAGGSCPHCQSMGCWNE